jgi:hypothetical protein
MKCLVTACLKHSTLDTCKFHLLCEFILRRLDRVLFCCQFFGTYITPHLNPSALAPLNHIAKTVSTLAETGYGPRYVRYCSEPVTMK